MPVWKNIFVGVGVASLIILWWNHGCGKEGVTLLIMIFRKQSCDNGGVAKESMKA